MEWEKPSPELGRILEEAAAPFTAVQQRKMFGSPAYYLNGNMLAGVYGRQLFLRLGPEERVRLQTELGAQPFEPIPGRPMKEYVAMPEAVWGHAEAMDEWMRRSVEFVAGLPPKQPKPRRSAGPKGAAPHNDPEGRR